MQTTTSVSARPVAPELGYRPELDGLRALAVGAVVAFHSYAGVADGGWLGVDVFFVLSGFLITTLLLRERQRTGRVRLSAFYARRMLRLLPVLAVLLVVVGAASRSARDGIPWVVGYVSNWGRVRGGEFGPLDHLWSLSVEEQFYVVWPLVLLALRRTGGLRTTLAATCALAVAATAARVVLFHTGVISGRHAYLGADMRADALLYGCALGVAFQLGWLHRASRFWRLAVVPAALGLVGVLVGPYGPGAPRAPFLFAPIDLAAAVVVAFVVTHPSSVPWLRARPLVRLGVVSYGIYLWHYPVMWALAGTGADPFVVLATAPPVAVALALTSWQLVEAPALRLKRRFTPA